MNEHMDLVVTSLIVVGAIVEWCLPRTRAIVANSLIEALANVLLALPIIGRLPLAGALLRALAAPRRDLPLPRRIARPPFVALVLAMSLVGGCSPASRARARDAARDVGVNCLVPSLVDAVIRAVVHLTTAGAAVSDPAEWRRFGLDLGSRHGPRAASCAVERVLAELAPGELGAGGRALAGGETLHVRVAERPQLVALCSWLRDHREQWASEQ